MGHASIGTGLGGEQRRDQYRQRRVLRTADGDLTIQSFAALYENLVQFRGSLSFPQLRQYHTIASSIILKYFDLPVTFGTRKYR